MEAAAGNARDLLLRDHPVTVPDLAPPAGPLPPALEPRRAELTAALTALTETMAVRLSDLRGRTHALARLSARARASRSGDLGRSLDLFG